MIRLEAKISKPDQKRMMAAIGKVRGEIIRQARVVPRLAAGEYAMCVIEAIGTQKYAGIYRPLSQKHRKWKRRHGYPEKFWVMTSTLLQSIRLNRIGSHSYFGGILNTTPGPKGKSPAFYGLRVEKGVKGKNFPARPVFRPEYEQFRQSKMPGILIGAKRRIAGKWN